MKARHSTLRRHGLALLALALLCIPAIQPLLTRDFTCGYDNTFHLWRAVQVDALWSRGVLYSRWAPDMAHGFGFPLFVFTSPFPSFLVAGLHRLGLAWSQALNAAFALGILLGGLAMYVLATDLSGEGDWAPWAGLVSALAYVYAPFQAYDVFNRGSLWESVAWAFPPLVLWGLERWTVHGERRGLWIGAGALLLLTVSHHLFAFLFAPLLGIWVLATALGGRDVRILGRGVLLGGLGMGLGAFFWLPPLLEQGYVQTGRLLGTWVFDYAYNFLSLGHLLALPRTADPSLVNDWPQKALGLVPLLLGALPLAGWRHLHMRSRWRFSVLLLSALGYSLMTLDWSEGLWNALPLLQYVQFPWRYLGPAAFCTALAASAGAGVVARWAGKRAPYLLGLLVLAPLMANLGWFYPDHCAPATGTSLSDMIAWERATDTLGTTAKGEYLPVWVERLPEEPAIADAYAAGRLPERLAGLPTGSIVYSVDPKGLGIEADVELPEAALLCYLSLSYPGWRAWVDGVSVAVQPEAEIGLVTFAVPKGRHRIEVRFVETPQRLAADALSIVSLIVLAVVGARPRRGDEPDSKQQTPGCARIPGPGGLFVGLAVLLVGLKLGVVDRSAVLWRSPRLTEAGTLKDVELPMAASFGGQAMLVGADPLPEHFAADSSPELTLYWRALTPEARDWHVGVALIGADETTRWAPLELRQARWGREAPPLTEWPADRYARMDYAVLLQPGMPPGTYTVALSLFDRATLVPESVLGADGNPVGPELTLQVVEVERPAEPPSLSELGFSERMSLHPCGALGLWSDPDAVLQGQPGEIAVWRVAWEALAQPDSDALAELALMDAVGAQRATWRLPLVASWWPSSLWATGDRWLGRLEVRLPGSLDSGTYQLSLSLPGCPSLASMAVQVEAPDRLWTVPEELTPADLIFGDQIRLAAWALDSAQSLEAGASLRVRLAWQALAEIETPYRVFLHLVSPDGRIVAQDDGEPAAWTRPTPGWAVGEVVVEERTLTLPLDAPAGRYLIRLGLYPQVGERLRLADGRDSVLLTGVGVGD